MTKKAHRLDPTPAHRFGLSEEYWDRVGENGREMYLAIRPMRQANYSVNHHIGRLEETLKSYEDTVGEGGTFDLNPDFQRGHVWDRGQQVAYMENVLRGVAPLVFRFNHPTFDGRTAPSTAPDALPPNQMTCIDGLQRITALRAFLAGEFKVFDRWHAADLQGTPFSLARYHVTFEVFSIPTRSELLTFYLDLNAGGTVHSAGELDRVRDLRTASLAAASNPSSKMKIR